MPLDAAHRADGQGDRPRPTYRRARWVDTITEDCGSANGRVDALDPRRAPPGLGVRCASAAAGASPPRGTSPPGAEAALTRALAIGRGAARGRGAAAGGARRPARGHWRPRASRTPFAIGARRQARPLLAADAAAGRPADSVALSSPRCAPAVDKRSRRNGRRGLHPACRPVRAAGCTRSAVDPRRARPRGAPTTSPAASSRQAGWEHVLASTSPARPRGSASEAVELLTARRARRGRRPSFLPRQLALQIHESIGHALELDRILLGEASYAGESWGDAGARPGRPALRPSSSASPRTPRCRRPRELRLGRRGVAAARTPLIVAGALRGNATTASRPPPWARRSGGCARAEGFARQPSSA